MADKSLGEARVRTDFNVSGSSVVDEIKQKSADLINLINKLPIPEKMADPGEFLRTKALALTDYENGCMWAVKAATF